jgi:hypothetical protein
LSREIVFLRPLMGTGGVQEWLNWHAWKVCIGEILSRVRIPSPPQTRSDSALVKDQGIFYSWTRGELARVSGRGIKKKHAVRRYHFVFDAPPFWDHRNEVETIVQCARDHCHK